MTSTEKRDKIIKIADDMKAEQIEFLDVREKTSMADFFIVCGGTSDRHADSIAEKIVALMRDERVRPSRTEGERSGWILIDYGDVIVHVMRDEQRQFYDIESLWKTKPRDPSVADIETK